MRVPRIVDQQVQPAAGVAREVPQRRRNRVAAGYIAGTAAGVWKLSGVQQGRHAVGIDVVEPHEPALGGKAPGGGQADALGGTGDENGLHGRIYSPATAGRAQCPARVVANSLNCAPPTSIAWRLHFFVGNIGFLLGGGPQQLLLRGRAIRGNLQYRGVPPRALPRNV